jgi:hypothetical protein
MYQPRAVGVLLLLALLFGSANGAVFTFIANSATITTTGGALLLNSAHTVLDWTDVTADDMTIDVTNLVSARIRTSSFNNVAFTATMTGQSGDAPVDAARQLWLLDNTFTFDGSTTFYQVGRDWTFKLDVQQFFLDPPPSGYPLHVDNFAIATAQATPLGFAGIEDRTGNPGIDTPTADLIPPIGLWIEGADPSSNAALLAHFVSPHGGTHCTSLDISVAYALSQLNHLAYGRVDPANIAPTSGDVRFNAEVCNGVGDCDPCATVPAGTPPAVEIGRWARTAVAYNPLTGNIDITIQVEDVNDDAVTISTEAYTTLAGTIAASASEPQCMNRDVAGPDTLIHSSDVTDGRFAAKGIWSVGAPYSITPNTVAFTVRDYTASLTMGQLAACSGDLSTALQMTVTFYVTHTALLDNAAVRVMDRNPQAFTMFWASQFSVGLGSSGNPINVVNPAEFRLVAREPIYNPPTENIFQVEIYTPKGDTPIAQTFPGGSLTLVYDDVPSLTPCNVGDGATVACTTTLTLNITDGCRPDEGVYPNAQFCYQLITIHTDKPYTFVLLPTFFPIELRDNEGQGALVSNANVFALLDDFVSTTNIEGVDDDIVVTVGVFAGGSNVFFDPTLDKPQEGNFTAGERMCFKFTVEGFNYTNTRWDKFGIDVTYGVYCALDPQNLAGITDFPPYTFNQRQITGCNAFIPAPVQRLKFMDAFSTACRVPQTGTLTDQRYLCQDGHDVQMLDNQHILGTCDSDDVGEDNKHCMIPSQTIGLSPNLISSDSCVTGPNNECSNGGNSVSPTPYKTNEISGVPASWDEKQCRDVTVGQIENIVGCTAGTAATVCAVPDECARPVHSVMLCLDAPLLTFGPLNTPAPVTFNFDVLVHLTHSTGVITSRRRMLSIDNPRVGDTSRELLRAGAATDNVPTAAQVDNLVIGCPGEQVPVEINGVIQCGAAVPGGPDPGTNTGSTGGASIRSVGAASGGFTLDAGGGEASAEAAEASSAVKNTAAVTGLMAALVVLLAGITYYGRKRLAHRRASHVQTEVEMASVPMAA